MSDDWNFHDAVEDGIRDNAGHLALAGALMAHSQRKQQLQSLEASRQHQAQIAKTEAERLEIEKQRLDLERLRHQEEKDRYEAVRLLRVMMAEAGAEFDGLMNRGQLKGSPIGPRRDYAMAVLMSKLELVRSRSGSLSDLNDLKELSRLENLAQDGVAKHFAAGDPLEVARAKWRELQAWMQGVDAFEKQVKQACGVVPDPTAVQLPSPTDLAAMQPKLEAFSAQLASELSEHAGRLPAEATSDGVLLSELAEQAQLEDLAAGKQASRAKAFANRWRQVAVTRVVKEPGMLTSHEVPPGLVQEVQSAVSKLQQWQDKATNHDRTLQNLGIQLEEGQLKAAEASVKRLGAVRFADLDYRSISLLERLNSVLKDLDQVHRGELVRQVKALRTQYHKSAQDSDLSRLFEQHEKRAAGEKRNVLIGVILIICLAAGGAKVGYDNHLKHQLLVAEAKAKADAEQKESQRLQAEMKAKADAERKDRHRISSIVKSDPSKLQKAMLGSKLDLPISSDLWQTFCFIAAGSFTMGSPASEDGHWSGENQVEVTLSQPFWLSKTEVTQAQWEAVMGSNPSNFKGTDLPVENVSWEDAQTFIAKLNGKQILPQGWKFALPTEAQWEYACRAGEKGPFSGGRLHELGWYNGNSGSKTHEVGQKEANAWGLHDMHGNVWEWCGDWYDDTLKGGVNPAGPSSGDYILRRGGSWDVNDSFCRAAVRGRDSPSERLDSIGFRPALVPSR